MVISPREPINGENATLKCTAGDFDPDLHSWVWQKGVNESYFDVTASDRILFSPVERAFLTFYSQTLTIVGLKESDEATYLCIVVESSTGTFINNGAGALFVNYPSEFPVCSPEGPAEVMVGDSLYCRTVSDERSPDARTSDYVSSLKSDWILISLNDTETGSQLEKKVTSIDDELTFFCFSISEKTNKTLSCKIGPLTVTFEASSITSPLLIAGIVISVLVTVFSFCVILLCFRYSPQCLCQIRMFFSRSDTPFPQSDSNNLSELQTGNHLYETSITGPPADGFHGGSGNNVLAAENRSLNTSEVDQNLTSVSECGMSHEGAFFKLNKKDNSNSMTKSANTDSYMELNPSKLNTDMYTELKL
ncbi:uncharacterized protein LOC110979047 [Acanthaster planci]|uniref:Uncharacterized protein LOC110979047 n=1 Tax=Acanthaster planci TaxID=133434 RepID=A0A8B7YAD8_ACAPL|nr:uncharacterized protein LOC110979047 [Acanthaster planci]